MDFRVICIDADAPPLFSRSVAGVRRGYEPDAAALVAEVLDRHLVWVFRPWGEMIPALQRGEGDAIWCGQGITPERRARVDFTRPYAVFDESVLVRAGDGIAAASDLRGRRVGAIAGSTNMALAETFDGAVTVPFDGSSADVFGEMIKALCGGAVDAVVDDDVALVPVADADDLAIAFTVATRNAWGVAVARSRPELRAAIDGALAQVIADGRLAAVWDRWMPTLTFPLTTLTEVAP
jgi:polar amino acid transport system substrate-binding protein